MKNLVEQASDQSERPFQDLGEEFESFLKKRQIQEEDYDSLSKIISIIDTWDRFVKEGILIGIFHNFFNFGIDNSTNIERLKQLKEMESSNWPDNFNEFIDLIISLTSKYEYYTTYQMLDILSRVK